MKKLLIFSFLLFFILTGCQNKEQHIKGNYNDKLLINSIPVSVEIVSGFRDMQKGLSNRNEMCENCGMLFKMGDSDIHNFWMGKMRFKLDFAYIENNKIVETYKNIPIYTDGEYTKIDPINNSNMVLELNAGFLDKNNIKVGDTIQLLNN